MSRWKNKKNCSLVCPTHHHLPKRVTYSHNHLEKDVYVRYAMGSTTFRQATNGWFNQRLVRKTRKKNKNLLMHHSFHIFSLTGHWVYNGIHHFQALKRTQRTLCYQPIMWPGMAGHRHLPSRKQTCLAGTYTIKILSRWFSHASLIFQPAMWVCLKIVYP